MDVYRMIGNTVGTEEAQELVARLSAWHDAMVAHERFAASRACDDECPHAEAAVLWNEALQSLGAKADELRFLRSRALGPVAAITRDR